MTIEALRKSLQSPYGIQSLNTHDIERAIEEFDALKESVKAGEDIIEDLNHQIAGFRESVAKIKSDAIMSAVEEYKREYCGQSIERMLTDYADKVRKGDE